MKRVLSLAIALQLCPCRVARRSGATGAQPAQTAMAPAKIATEADYAAHMKEIGQLNGVLNKSIKGGMADEAAKAATRLEVLFKNIHAYWNEKKVADATTAAQTAVTSLQAVQKALAANDMAAAETARATVAARAWPATPRTARRRPKADGK